MEARVFDKDGINYRIEDIDDFEDGYVCDNNLEPINGEICDEPAIFETTALNGPNKHDGPYLCRKHAVEFSGLTDLP